LKGAFLSHVVLRALTAEPKFRTVGGERRTPELGQAGWAHLPFFFTLHTPKCFNPECWLLSVLLTIRKAFSPLSSRGKPARNALGRLVFCSRPHPGTTRAGAPTHVVVGTEKRACGEHETDDRPDRDLRHPTLTDFSQCTPVSPPSWAAIAPLQGQVSFLKVKLQRELDVTRGLGRIDQSEAR
jgi:hypothetical protein